MATAATATVLYARASELRAAQEARADAGGKDAQKLRRPRPNAVTLRVEAEHLREGRAGARWLTAQALLDGFPREAAGRGARFFVRQPVPGQEGRYMWLLTDSPYEQLLLEDDMLQVQVVEANEFPCLAAHPDADVWNLERPGLFQRLSQHASCLAFFPAWRLCTPPALRTGTLNRTTSCSTREALPK
ncbi:Protein kinase, putative [Hondaea fermentalgiana]|uniref:Protein kinase, putative n=1 Tax=Hondaea fermentalgiana TaxID=2315210 RepID=A0A2R5GG33_9STRA|nr:Protein kinase, putative [Hondaea fermentalgiana]|eukprot:GBG27201.1 Protein kinase, putative [Hondaea fermentalgiana]